MFAEVLLANGSVTWLVNEAVYKEHRVECGSSLQKE